MSAISQQPIGQSPAFHALMDRVSDAAALDRSVLVVGERGTGKELIASRLHFLSPRWEQTYISVNCAAYSDQLLDEALFGQSFFDGRSDIDGQFVRADGGTLFLNNIEQVSLRLQEKLLQALEYGIIDPLGSPDTQEVDVRVICAASSDINKAVSEGCFRADLLDRIAFDVIGLPPLRDRIDDVIPLSESFGRKMAVSLGTESFPGFTAEAMAALMGHSWPGNVRDLKMVVERSTAKAFLEDESLSAPIAALVLDPFKDIAGLSASLVVDPAIPAIIENGGELAAPPPAVPESKAFSERVVVFERGLIDEALIVTKNHQGRAAEHLGLTYHQFRGLLRKHGLKK